MIERTQLTGGLGVSLSMLSSKSLLGGVFDVQCTGTRHCLGNYRYLRLELLSDSFSCKHSLTEAVYFFEAPFLQQFYSIDQLETPSSVPPLNIPISLKVCKMIKTNALILPSPQNCHQLFSTASSYRI